MLERAGLATRPEQLRLPPSPAMLGVEGSAHHRKARGGPVAHTEKAQPLETTAHITACFHLKAVMRCNFTTIFYNLFLLAH